MNEITQNVNWIAVIVGAIASFLIGWLWYSPKVFGLKWAEGVGVVMPTQDNPDASPPSALAMVIQMASTLLLSWVVGVTAANNALSTLILVILTIVALMAAGGLFCKKSHYAIATETGFVVVMAVVMVLCQAIL